MFFIRDPLKFPDFIHTQKRDPHSNLKSAQNVWDFWSHSPEALHQITILFSDRGIPDGYRHMHGFGSHTFSLINSQGERHWVKWHYKTRQGIKNLDPAVAAELAGTDPDYAQRDLFNAIAQGDFPQWDVCMQVMTEAQAAAHHDNPFDVTKTWSQREFPLIKVGILELNRNPQNYHAEIEQAALAPSNVVPGLVCLPTACFRDVYLPMPMRSVIESVPIISNYQSTRHAARSIRTSETAPWHPQLWHRRAELRAEQLFRVSETGSELQGAGADAQR